MSVSVTTDIHCDGCRTEWTSGVTDVKVNAADARKIAKQKGWTCKGGKDLCPRCKPEEPPKPAVLRRSRP